MKSFNKIVSSLAALLFVALIGLFSFHFPAVSGFTRKALGLGVILGMVLLAVSLFPRSRNKRLVVRREVMLGASVGLFIGAVLLLLGLMNAHDLLALIFGHSAHIGGGMLAAGAPVFLSPEKARELEECVQSLKQSTNVVNELPGKVKALNDGLTSLAEGYGKLRSDVGALQKSRLQAAGQGFGLGKYVSEECAEFLAAIVIMGAEKAGKLVATEGTQREGLLRRAAAIIQVQQRAAVTTGDIPLPVDYAKQVVQLVWKYGQARQYGMVFPMGAGTVNWPRLKTEPLFSYIATSGAVPEKVPQLEYVQFAAKKFGGVIRIPTEIDQDSLGAFGQFIANYIARQMAKIEDLAFFTALGDGTYGGIKGMCKAALDAGNVVTLAAGKTKPSDMTVSDWRNLRAAVDPAALATGAYYCARNMDSLLVTFNTINNPLIYQPERNGQPATLDGYPIHWVGVMPSYSTVANASAMPVLFADLTYGYLGVRDDIRIQTSLDVYFATDEIGIRALERFDVNLMANGAAAVLQLAAA